MTSPVVAPRSIGAVLDGGMRLWLQGVRPLLVPSILIGLAGLCPYLALRLFSGSWTYAAGINSTALAAFETIGLACFVLRAWWVLGLYNWHDARVRGEPMAIGFALRKAARLLPRRLRLLLIEVLAALLIAVPIIMVFFALSSLNPTLVAMLAPLMLIPYGLVIGGLFLRFGLAHSLIALEEKRAFDALGDSWNLTKSNFWRIAALLLVLWTFYVILIACMAALVVSYDSLLGKPRSLVQPQVGVLLSIFGAWSDAFFSAALYSLLCDLKARRHGDDLVVKVQNLVSA